MQFITLFGIPAFIACLVIFESLQDVYLQQGMSSEWRDKMKVGIKKVLNISFTDTELDMFVDALVDNSLQKLDILKTIVWANTGLFIINALEDKVQEKFGTLKGNIFSKLGNFIVPGKFSKAGGAAGVVRDLVVQKNQQVKKMSDYLHQGTMTGSNLQNACNTASLPTMVRRNQFDKLSPKEQATYKSVMAMLNTVQASR